MTSSGNVTEFEELASLHSGEALEGYLPENENVAKSLAACADATDCIFFEGALTDRPGGVVRVEPIEIDSVLMDLAHVVPGYSVTGSEVLFYTAESAVQEAIENGELTEAEWSAMSEQDQEELVEQLKQEFRQQNNIQFKVDQAMRIELVRIEATY